MATGSLIEWQGKHFTGSAPAEDRKQWAARVALRRSRGFTREGDTVYVSTSEGLNGARAAVLGVALEVLLAALVTGAWLLWRSLRWQ
ncbi:MAG TPA: hypothetical protein VE291_11270 [Terracidiphilus sp.]|jgi:hypothetical protein|nr:hypothetical protein [Terracidiphilus sp.]